MKEDGTEGNKNDPGSQSALSNLNSKSIFQTLF